MSDAWPEPPAPEMLEKLLVNLRVSSLQKLPHQMPTPSNRLSNEPAPAEPNPLAWDADIHPELLDAYLQETPGQIS